MKNQVSEAFEALAIEVDGRRHLEAEQLGELIFLVTRKEYQKAAFEGYLRMLDPVHDLKFLDVEQCQFVIDKIAAVTRVDNISGASNIQTPRGGGGAEMESEECCEFRPHSSCCVPITTATTVC